ncbi:MAG: polymer-forming cytoskeletal protein [Treponema sp.]|nr:polymer-forming cytoskeletal protein [Treponema sp.]MBR1714565.1 polymer-forming cytoskeletal protein [Treponema sp.]
MAEDKKKNLTVFGQETEFDGELEFTDSLVITGKFKGSINATGDLEIDENAVCDVVKMKAKSIEISGKVTGDVEAPECIELCSGSVVKGDMVSGRIRIADDVDYEGEVSMFDNAPEIDLFSVVSDEYKNAIVLKSNLPK